MSIDITKPISKVIYNGEEIEITGGVIDAGSSGKYNIEQMSVDGGCEIHITNAETDTTLYYCKAIDYDGSVLKEGWYSKGQEFVLPAFPTHDRLIAQEWSATSEIVDNKIIVDRDLLAGVVYTTTSGLTEFDMILTEETGLTVALNINGTKNWGDGTTDTTDTHTYTEYGNYMITCNATEIVSNKPDQYYAVLDTEVEGGNKSCVAIRTGSNVTKFGDFTYVDNITHITLSNSVTSLKGSVEYGSICDSHLKAFIIPSKVIECSGLVGSDILVAPLGLKQLGDFRGNEIVMPDSLESIGNLKAVLPKKLFFSSNVKKIGNIIANAEEIEFSEGVVSVGAITSPARKIKFSNTITQLGTISECVVGELELPNSLLQLRRIYDCDYLKEIIIPDNVTAIETKSFSGCDNLSKIVFPKSLTTLPSSLGPLRDVCVLDFSKCENVCSSSAVGNLLTHPLTIAIVPDNLYDAWIADSNWSKYKRQVKKASEV